MSQGIQRRLAAIVAADIDGYSRLVGRDEEGTLQALRAHRSELIEPLIEAHGGRIANTAGDSFVLEFPSAVEALRWAIALQEGMEARNDAIESDGQIRFRVGINVGDVITEGNDLLGDGVNIAARLEGLANPGGICISRTTHDQVRDRLEVEFEDRGEVEVKNIARPVHVYAIRSLYADINDIAPEPKEATGKPALAILPFDNMSGDAEQDYFADGVTEDLITALSRFYAFTVIARNSTFTYKGKNIDVREDGRTLGARYVLEGSVRKAGDRVGISAQLIDAASGNHIWADRYDRTLSDIFELQDEITERIASAIYPAIEDRELKTAL